MTDTPNTKNTTSKSSKITKTAQAAPVPDAPPTLDLAPPDRTTRALMRRLPRYEQIALDLRARIESGELAPGAPIPSETEMITQYGVSRITVRHAVAALRAAGLIVTEHGRASRVRPSLVTAATADQGSTGGRLAFTPAVTRDPASEGGAYRTWDADGWADVETPSRYRINAGRHAAALALKSEEPVFVYERQLLHTSGVQVMHRVLVPADTAATAGLEDPFQPPANLFQALAESGHELQWREAVQAEMPTPDEAATLDIPDGVPLLIHTRTTHAVGMPLAIEETRLPADRTTITVTQRS